MFSEIRLETSSAWRMLEFYGSVLELPVEHDNAATVHAGETRLTFVNAVPSSSPCYHFAFNIATDLFPAALEWLRRRIALLEVEGSPVVPFDDWEAQALYFFDPDGNVVELIARGMLEPAGSDTFVAREHILCVSEIGCVTADVAGMVASLETEFGLCVYRNSIGDRFAAVGDESGLIIVVEEGRDWFPQGPAAAQFPMTLRMRSVPKAIFEPTGTPYRIIGGQPAG